MKNLRIGLTGSIATGKSTVADLFKKTGCEICDADLIAHQILNNQSVRNQIIDLFGENVLNHQNLIDRKRLADIVFKTEASLKKLNRILHPLIIDQLELRWKKFSAQKKGIFIEVVPLLYEVGLEKRYHKVIVVFSSLENQLLRINNRGWTQDHFFQRLKNLISLEEKKKRADYLIENNNSFETLNLTVTNLSQQLIKEIS